jgi:hypothetical protein
MRLNRTYILEAMENLGKFWERSYPLSLCPSTALRTRNNSLAERSRSQQVYSFREIALEAMENLEAIPNPQTAQPIG